VVALRTFWSSTGEGERMLNSILRTPACGSKSRRRHGWTFPFALCEADNTINSTRIRPHRRKERTETIEMGRTMTGANSQMSAWLSIIALVMQSSAPPCIDTQQQQTESTADALGAPSSVLAEERQAGTEAPFHTVPRSILIVLSGACVP
jgi:hypothetical protein